MDNLQTSRVILRPFIPADAPQAFACMSERLSPYTAWRPPRSRAEFRRIWEGWIEGARAGTELCMTARHADTQKFLGLAGLKRIPSGRPEIGIWVRTELQGRGHGMDMVQILIRRASARYSPQHFRYPVALDNRPSRRIAERLGGAIVGRYRTDDYDGVIYAIPPVE